jgi:hypothetical protein
MDPRPHVYAARERAHTFAFHRAVAHIRPLTDSPRCLRHRHFQRSRSCPSVDGHPETMKIARHWAEVARASRPLSRGHPAHARERDAPATAGKMPVLRFSEPPYLQGEEHFGTPAGRGGAIKAVPLPPCYWRLWLFPLDWRRGRGLECTGPRHDCSGSLPTPHTIGSLTEGRMVLAGLILVISTALCILYLLESVKRILRPAFLRK